MEIYLHTHTATLGQNRFRGVVQQTICVMSAASKAFSDGYGAVDAAVQTLSSRWCVIGFRRSSSDG